MYKKKKIEFIIIRTGEQDMAQVVLRKILLTMIALLLLNSGAQAKGTFEVVCRCGDHSIDSDLTRLKDGRILISDFYRIDSSAESKPEDYKKLFEIYDPKTNTIKQITPPKIWREPGTAPIVLDDGKLLYLGYFEESFYPKPFQLQMYKDSLYAELYDPETDTYEIAGKMNVPRELFTLEQLENGKILVMNGIGTILDEMKTKATVWQAELYDPETKQFSLDAESSIDFRKKYAQVGRTTYKYDDYVKNVRDKLIPKYPEGDIRNRLPGPKVEIYEIRETNVGSSILLDSGEVLTLNGRNNTSEIYNPETHKFRQIEGRPYSYNLIYTLPDGRVVTIESDFGGSVFDPKTEKFTQYEGIPEEELPKEMVGTGYRMRWLLNDKILVFAGHKGGWGFSTATYPLYEIYLYDLKTKTIKVIDKEPKHIWLGDSVLLDDGSILFIGMIRDKSYMIIYKNKEIIEGDENENKSRKHNTNRKQIRENDKIRN